MFRSLSTLGYHDGVYSFPPGYPPIWWISPLPAARNRGTRGSAPRAAAAFPSVIDCLSRACPRLRIEHWVVAERQSQIAVRNMPGQRERYAAVPFFENEHHQLAVEIASARARGADLESMRKGQARLLFEISALVAEIRDAPATTTEDFLALPELNSQRGVGFRK